MNWLPLTPEQAAKLKAEHSGETLHVTEIKLPKQAGGGTATIVWREPTYDDWDAAQEANRLNPEDAQAGDRFLAEAIIVWPDEQHVTALIELPNALNRSFAKDVTPFFGAGSTVKSRLL